MTDIMFRCEGGGDVLLTLETDDEWTTYPDYTIIIHQTAKTNTYYVDANSGSNNNSGLSPSEAFATIQKAVDSAYDGETIIVQPGRYLGDVNFLGKNIVLRSTDPNDSAIVEQTIIGGDFRLDEPEAVITFCGDEQPSCRLWGFNIKGYIRGTDGVSNTRTHATISNCLLCNSKGYCSTVIEGCDGLIENCIIAGNNMYLCSIFSAAVESCYGTIRNCTFANNMTEYAISLGNGGTARIENCIMYDSYVFIRPGGFADISYTNLKGYAFEIDVAAIAVCNTDDPECASKYDGLALGPGLIFADPCYVQGGDGSMGIAGDYHLKSKRGRWDLNDSKWVYDVTTSRCIDAGNPGYPLGEEPWGPFNRRINMGAYGGTAEASKTPVNWSRLADLTNDGIVDAEDFACLTKDRYSTHKEKCGDLNRDGAVRMDDVAVLVGEWLKTTAWH
ncbi:MAG: right-handed parallel beta-helix repeat-containing protein [Planctomycetota bacterium]